MEWELLSCTMKKAGERYDSLMLWREGNGYMVEVSTAYPDKRQTQYVEKPFENAATALCAIMDTVALWRSGGWTTC